MTAWQRLGLNSPTSDKEVIQRAYEQCLKSTEAQSNPVTLQQLQADFEWATAWAEDWHQRQSAMLTAEINSPKPLPKAIEATANPALDLGNVARQVYTLALDAPETALVELDHRLEREITSPAARAELGERLLAAIVSEPDSSGAPLSFIRGVTKRFAPQGAAADNSNSRLLEQIEQRMQVASCQEVLAREQEHQSDLNPVGASAIALIRSSPNQADIDRFASSGPKRIALLNQYHRLQETFPNESKAVFSSALTAWVRGQTEPGSTHKKTNRSPKTVGSEHPWFAFSAIVSVMLLLAIAVVFATSGGSEENLAPAPSINWSNIAPRASFAQHPRAARCEAQLKGAPRYLAVESCNRYIELLAQSEATKAGAASSPSAQSYKKSTWLGQADDYDDYVRCIYKQPNRPFYLRDQSCFKKQANTKKYAQLPQQLADCFVDFPGLFGEQPTAVMEAAGLPEEQKRCGRLQVTLRNLAQSNLPLGITPTNP